MAHIYSYLTFSGNCRKAMTFYQHCLGGNLSFRTIGETPLSTEMTDEMRGYVVQATLTKEDLILVGTDLVSDEGLTKGNAVSLLLNCNSDAELGMLFIPNIWETQAFTALPTKYTTETVNIIT